jgi:hypothetical protein
MRAYLSEIERRRQLERALAVLERKPRSRRDHRAAGCPAQNPRLCLRIRQRLNEVERAAEQIVGLRGVAAVPRRLARDGERAGRLKRIDIEQRFGRRDELATLAPARRELGPRQLESQPRVIAVAGRPQSERGRVLVRRRTERVERRGAYAGPAKREARAERKIIGRSAPDAWSRSSAEA